MNHNKTLLYLGIAANALTLLFALNAKAQPGGSGAGLAFIIFLFPAIWIITLITATVLTIKNRKTWFQEKLRWTIFSLFICTPIPIMIVLYYLLDIYVSF